MRLTIIAVATVIAAIYLGQIAQTLDDISATLRSARTVTLSH